MGLVLISCPVGVFLVRSSSRGDSFVFCESAFSSFFFWVVSFSLVRSVGLFSVSYLVGVWDSFFFGRDSPSFLIGVWGSLQVLFDWWEFFACHL